MSLILAKLKGLRPLASLGRGYCTVPPDTIIRTKQSAFVRSIYKGGCSFPKYGLLLDDLMRENDPDVCEALKRLPDKYHQERNFRAVRAAQLFIENRFLPKEEWTTWETDHRYLLPYYLEVKEERKQMEEWQDNH